MRIPDTIFPECDLCKQSIVLYMICFAVMAFLENRRLNIEEDPFGMMHSYDDINI